MFPTFSVKLMTLISLHKSYNEWPNSSTTSSDIYPSASRTKRKSLCMRIPRNSKRRWKTWRWLREITNSCSSPSTSHLLPWPRRQIKFRTGRSRLKTWTKRVAWSLLEWDQATKLPCPSERAPRSRKIKSDSPKWRETKIRRYPAGQTAQTTDSETLKFHRSSESRFTRARRNHVLNSSSKVAWCPQRLHSWALRAKWRRGKGWTRPSTAKLAHLHDHRETTWSSLSLPFCSLTRESMTTPWTMCLAQQWRRYHSLTKASSQRLCSQAARGASKKEF